MQSKRTRVAAMLRSIAEHPVNQGLWFGALIVLILFAPIGSH